MAKKNITPVEALKKAVKIAGGQTELAKLCSTKDDKLKQQNVWVWLNRDEKTSAKWVAKVSTVTGVPCHELRPDIFPAPTAAANDSNATPHTA